MGLNFTLQEVEDHFHNRERWLGAQAVVGRVAGDVLATFQAVSGNNVYGAALQIMDVNDTPILAGSIAFDPRMVLFTAASTNTLNKLRFIFGVSNVGNAEAAGQYTEMVYEQDAGATTHKPVELRCPRLPSGTLMWVKLWNAANLATVNFVFGMHEYGIPATVALV